MFSYRDTAHGKSLKVLARHWNGTGLLDWSGIDFAARFLAYVKEKRCPGLVAPAYRGTDSGITVSQAY